MKKVIATIVTLMVTYVVKAQEAVSTSSKGFWDDPIHHPMFSVYLVSFFVFIVIILTMVVAIMMLRVLRIFFMSAAKEKAAKLGIPYVMRQSGWSKFWEKANDLVPLEEEKNIELDHNFDGIRELDNHLPPWWKGLFYGSMIFAVIYIFVYHFSGTLPLSGQEYENEIVQAAEQVRILRASQPAEVIDLEKLIFTHDEALIARGKKVFMSSNCGSCHRNDGGGNGIGPNLTDSYWLHGGEIKNIFSTVNKGVIEKAMPAWGKVMSQKDVRDVAFYVMSLQGTNPQNPKLPQGVLFVPKQDSLKRDSTNVKIISAN